MIIHNLSVTINDSSVLRGEVMISREQLKLEIDRVDDHTLSILSQIVMALKSPTTLELNWSMNNPLKNSVIYEGDIISPINEVWDVEQ
ncbi:MAG: hypothetical protein KA717_02920 [Woronichinia naegeliana WA131]|jgi:hypothetical protein|uniref:Uncharacterized protein n=1 Tax=Woronichinia naegeliana WA131 TaxID=2824559 RepID=A0A977KXV0_9CYAN|nr:MAG: hypothetical protein KA717_02920 [Woronichinia naegeliana WA131]